MSDVPIETPLIYTRLGLPPRLNIAERIAATIIAIVCFSGMMLALYLQPSHSGTGTHTELGFNSCQFLNRTGLPCPSCGMTTSFSWFARGNVVASFYIQPMGCLLAILTVACGWTATYVALTGKPAHRLIQLVPARYYLLPLMMFAVLAWGWKMFIYVKGIDGW